MKVRGGCNGENKRKARLNCIEHLLVIDYSEVKAKIELPQRREMKGLTRPPMESQRLCLKMVIPLQA